MFQKVEMTIGWWLFIWGTYTLFVLWTLIDLIKNADWKEVVVFIIKCIVTVPIFLWCDTMNPLVGCFVSLGWYFLVFEKYK